jgi:hypothetical protein
MGEAHNYRMRIIINDREAQPKHFFAALRLHFWRWVA